MDGEGLGVEEGSVGASPMDGSGPLFTTLLASKLTTHQVTNRNRPNPSPKGAHEGAYAWLTLNYLLGTLDAPRPEDTVAAIDLGGGSVQEAFALPAEEAAAAPAGYVTRLRAGGREYSVYVHRWVRSVNIFLLGWAGRSQRWVGGVVKLSRTQYASHTTNFHITHAHHTRAFHTRTTHDTHHTRAATSATASWPRAPR
jgi:hypothetical protein